MTDGTKDLRYMRIDRQENFNLYKHAYQVLENEENIDWYETTPISLKVNNIDLITPTFLPPTISEIDSFCETIAKQNLEVNEYIHAIGKEHFCQYDYNQMVSINTNPDNCFLFSYKSETGTELRMICPADPTTAQELKYTFAISYD